MSGAVSDDTAKSIGKFLGADTIITGNLIIIGTKYRLGIKSLHVETGIVQSLFISDVRIDNELSTIIRSTSSFVALTQQNQQRSINNNSIYNIYQSGRINNWSTSSIISPDGRWVINAYSEIIYINDIIDGKRLRTISVSNNPKRSTIDSTNMSIDGRHLIISFDDSDSYGGNTYGRILFIDILTGRITQNIRIDGGRNWSSRCYNIFNPANNKLIATSGNKIHIFNLNTGNKISTSIRMNGNIRTIASSNDGSRIAIGDSHGTIYVLDGNNLRVIYTLRGHDKAISSLAISPNNKILLSGSEDFTIGIWDLNVGRELFTIAEHHNTIINVLFTIDGNQFLSSSTDGTVKLWDLNTFSIIRNYTDQRMRMSLRYFYDRIKLTIDGNYFITSDGYLYKI